MCTPRWLIQHSVLPELEAKDSSGLVMFLPSALQDTPTSCHPPGFVPQTQRVDEGIRTLQALDTTSPLAPPAMLICAAIRRATTSRCSSACRARANASSSSCWSLSSSMADESPGLRPAPLGTRDPMKRRLLLVSGRASDSSSGENPPKWPLKPPVLRRKYACTQATHTGSAQA